jgi:hypothetical protein
MYPDLTCVKSGHGSSSSSSSSGSSLRTLITTVVTTAKRLHTTTRLHALGLMIPTVERGL